MGNPQLVSTSADDDTVGASDENVGTSADERVAPRSTSESTSGDETSVDEKDASERSKQEDGQEEEEECGFCIFMKGGPCGEEFKQWQECVDGAEKSQTDIVEQCARVTTLLKVCMKTNPQYYGPVLDAEKAMLADTDSSEETTMDGAHSAGSPAGEGGERENGEQTVVNGEALPVVVDDEGQVAAAFHHVEVEVKAL